jgi:uroporphyrinogen-III synthase
MKTHGDIPSRPEMRALLTRPRAEAEALAGLLAQRGIDSVIEPMLDIVDRDATLPDLGGIQAILCTSANGVRALARTSDERRIPVFAVGDATARAACEAGFRTVESAGGDVEDLALLVIRRLRPSGGELLHVAGSDVAGDLTAALRATGFIVERAVLYEARAVEALSAATARLIGNGEIDLALFYSPRSAAIFARLAEAAKVTSGLAATVAVSISASADATLSRLPFRDRAVAAAPTQAALLACVEQFAPQPVGARS